MHSDTGATALLGLACRFRGHPIAPLLRLLLTLCTRCRTTSDSTQVDPDWKVRQVMVAFKVPALCRAAIAPSAVPPEAQGAFAVAPWPNNEVCLPALLYSVHTTPSAALP
ncbi:hypothetical protein C8J57DRAFT_1538958 [Mycena rebaudengoi]|nr:hypothetical protein C8J57DRAFT_1538958 [Mycena rebaudengoi]